MPKKLSKFLLVHKETKFDVTKQALKQVEAILKQKKVSYKKISVSMLLKEDLNGFDKVIILGGDGTILKTCKYVYSQPVILINSDPTRSKGAITDCAVHELEKLTDVLDGKFVTRLRQRLEVKINNSSLEEPVLNEVFFGSIKASMMSEYEISYTDSQSGVAKKETQRSSGVIISTGTGSTAWFNSAGGKAFNPSEEKAKFIVREAYDKKNLTIFEGEAIGSDFKLVVKKEDMCLSMDSYDLQLLDKEDKVTFKISKFPLKVLCPQE